MRRSRNNDVKPRAGKLPQPEHLLDAFESLVDRVRNSALDESYWSDAEPCLSVLTQKLGITHMQASLLAVVLNADINSSMDLEDISEFLGFSNNIHIFRHIDDLEHLCSIKLLALERNHCGDTEYKVPSRVLKAFREDHTYQPEDLSGLSAEHFYDEVRRLLRDFDRDRLTYEMLEEDIQSVVRVNQQLQCCRTLQARYQLTGKDLITVLFACYNFVYEEQDCLVMRELSQFFDSHGEFRCYRNDILNGHSRLITDKVIEPICMDGMRDNESYHLTYETKQQLLGELNIPLEQVSGTGEIKCDKIVAKELFYNDKEHKEIGTLRELLGVERFEEVKESMRQQGLPTGFTCLFHGAPGTGKTETVLQLARVTGRNIMQVDISSMRDKFVGETEKNAKALFMQYRRLASQSHHVPILLFNEADGLLGRRTTAREQRGVEKMENAMQNIFLQEMETFDGILIATTNLTCNLDTAFERRFLYKIRFDKPQPNVVAQIWRSKLKSLSAEHAQQLAIAYQLSGGQIDNVVRRHSISNIIAGTPNHIDINQLHELCSTECLDNSSSSRRVGFSA